ncbi:MAG: TonB-dependent receptor, partial [Rhizorhabdus sp.]|nr:TonB-dependent receptor [Rhizorhabdus sp.]
MIRYTAFARTLLGGTALLLSQQAMAQEAEQTGVEDIVVTARRTEESLQTTPVAVTALSDRALVQAQVKDVSDLQRTAPSLVIAKGGASTTGFAFVAIRGQGNLQPILANDPAVGTYIDGVYVARPSVGLTDLQDIQRLEVLRGPQGTLFGRNTTGGAVNIISKDPEPDKFSGQVKGEVGSQANRSVGLTLNIPLVDRLAFRINYNFRDRDGYGKSLTTGLPILDVNSHFVRAKLKYEGDTFDVVLSGDYNRMKDHGSGIQLSAVNPALVPAAFQPAMLASLHTSARWWDSYSLGTTAAAATNVLPADVQALYGVKPFDRLKVYGFSGTINVDLGALKLKSISAWRHSENVGLADTDGSPAPTLATFAGSKSDYASQELQISGDVTDALSFIAGGYYGHEDGTEYSRSQIFAGRLRDSTADVVNKTFGLFAQAYYDITDTLRAAGGFRYTWDKRDSVLHNAQVLGLPYDAVVAGTPFGINCTVKADSPPTATTCNQTQRVDFDYPAWTFGLDWQATSDLFVYAKTSAAAKAGGWNLRAGGLPAFAPEKVRDVELGAKSDLFDHHVRLNAALFHTWKKGNQAVVNAFAPGIGVTQYIQNNGDVRIWGLESELTVIPWTGMELGGNMSLMDGKYRKGSFQETQIIAGSGCTNPAGVANGCVVDLSDLPLIQLPKRQFNLSARQTFELPDGDLSVQGSWAYVSSQHYNTVKAAVQQSAAAKAQYAVEN